MASAQELGSMTREEFIAANPQIAEQAFKGTGSSKPARDYVSDPNNVWNQFGGWITGANKSYENAYQAYLDELSVKRAEESEHSARAFEEYMSSTAYQRAVKDALAAGLNPRLLLENKMQGASTPSAQGIYSINRSSSVSDSNSKSSSFSSSALIIGIIAALVKLAAL